MMTQSKVNEKIDEFEAALRKAEADIETALKAVCPLHGPVPRYDLTKALEAVQEGIRGAWKLRNNPEIY